MSNLPPPLPPLFRDQRKVDTEQLRLLAILHFVFAGLAIAGVGFLLLHYSIMHTVFDNPEMWKQSTSGPPPAEFFAIFKWFYVVFGTLLVAAGLGNLLSGLFIQKREHRTFSLVIAGLNCIQLPLGTALGVFGFVVLLRDSVRELYEAHRA